MSRFPAVALAISGFVGITVLIGAASLSAAAPSVASVISTRQANFKKLGGAMKVLKDELRDNGDKAKMIAAAKTIAAIGRQQTSLFPSGSGTSSGIKTDALLTIWTDRATFETSMKKMIAEADKLAAVAGSDNSSATIAQFKMTGATCGACHRQFRAD